MIIVGNKNSCEVPVVAIEKAIAALATGEQEEYDLGVCDTQVAEDTPSIASGYNHNLSDPEL